MQLIAIAVDLFSGFGNSLFIQVTAIYQHDYELDIMQLLFQCLTINKVNHDSILLP